MSAVLTPRARTAHEALAQLVEQYADVFAPSCPDHDGARDCGCTRHLTAWVLVHEWTSLADDSMVAKWNTGIGTGYFHALGLLHAALHDESGD